MRIASSMSQLDTKDEDNYERRVTDVCKPTVSIAKNLPCTPLYGEVIRTHGGEKFSSTSNTRTSITSKQHTSQALCQTFLCREILHLALLADL
jgi:hypothetical protein